MPVEEAHTLADRLGLTWTEFTQRHLDKRWPLPGTVVLRQKAGRCLFLDQPEGSIFGLCRIHEFKPTCCDAWQASLDRKECRQGLSGYWNLTVGEDGQLQGTPDDLRSFQTFLKTLEQ